VLFKITHTTTYTFSRPAFLEPHTIRLQPRCDSSQRLVRFDQQIEPKPAGLSKCLDIEGNSVVHVWFDGLTESLRILTRCEVETCRENPFDYLVNPAASRLPVEYPDDLRPSLAPYCFRRSADEAVTQLAGTIAGEVDKQTLPFLAALNRRISQMCEVTIREEGEPQAPGVTLAQRHGACRDLAVLFMDVCRALGLGARFVSGYQEGDPDQEGRHLHAWAEVCVPGGGWRGYDPTWGLAIADAHVALAAAPEPAGTMPVEGSFTGSARSRMSYHVEIETE